MAMLASKSPYAASLSSNQSTLIASSAGQPSYPPPRRAATMPMHNQSFASPTESEFSESDGPDSVKYWDEDSVCEYLRSVKCGDYEKLFRKNHINGENLLEMDKEVLKEMGIDKVGDRVRLFLGIKKLRTQAYANQKKRNRVSLDHIRRHSGTPLTVTIRTHTLAWTCNSSHQHHQAPLGRPIRPLGPSPRHRPISDTPDSMTWLSISTLGGPHLDRTLLYQVLNTDPAVKDMDKAVGYLECPIRHPIPTLDPAN